MTASTTKRAISLCLAGALVLAQAAPSAAQIYKWVDEAGTVHFSDSPPAKPGSSGGSVEVLPRSEPRPAAPSRSSSTDRPAAADPYDEERPDDEAWVDQAADPVEEQVEEEVDVEIYDDGAVDAAVRYRANSPRNRPGQPIRQPAARASGRR